VSELVRSTLLKLVFPGIAIALVLFVSRRRGLSWREHLGFVAPP